MMDDSIPKDDNTAESAADHVNDEPSGDLSDGVGSNQESEGTEAGWSKPVSEPPPPPPLLRGQRGDGELGSDESSTGSGAVSEWLMDWADVHTDVVEDARTTRKIPAIDPHEPPAAAPIIEGLKRTADTGDEAPTIEPDRGEFTEARQAPLASRPPVETPNAADAIVPSPPPVRTPPLGSPLAEGPIPTPWSDGSSSSAPIYGPVAEPPAVIAGPFGGVRANDRPEVTEHDIARLARTTSTSVIDTRTVRLGGVNVTFGSQRSLAVAGAVAMTLLVALMALVVSGLGVDRSGTETVIDTGSRDAAVFADDSNLLANGVPPASPDISELARSTVQVVGLDDQGRRVCVGSGVIVHHEGVILTNAHVVTVAENCNYTTIGVAVTDDISAKPKLLYEADVLVRDDKLDLAVLQVIGPLATAPDAPFPHIFPVAELGDSDLVQLGDELGILGYPVIGGDTITATTGSVGGFTSQEGIGERALIKTEASVTGGNSGGMAYNNLGHVIGIPTRARATESGPAVDCRPLEDTNDDGDLDDKDNCTPVGGFLNGIRPINLAVDVLNRADAIREASGERRLNRGTFDLSGVLITNPRFSSGEQNNSPTGVVPAIPEGGTEICLFVDWTGIPDGVPWDAVWLVDDEQIGDFGRLDQIWDFGDFGRNFWYCAKDENGHEAGIYEMGLFLDGQLMFVETIQVVDDEADVYEVTWVNKSEFEICGLAINPLAESRHVGLNELDAGAVIGVGESLTLELPEGDLVVEASDCSGRPVAVELDGLEVPGDTLVDGEVVPFVIGEAG